jgi:2-polyprenyl-3-methyl-5-hydroxy-6-metoxy-1,4-benzoquinol methylase
MAASTGLISRFDIYKLDETNRELLIQSAQLMREWSDTYCASKSGGGMEEWAKKQEGANGSSALTCDWYHGTWQFLRLLNMVAVPAWYEFYQETLTRALKERPGANILISAAADYGMLATLHQAVVASGTSPTITLVDICETPLRATQWFAERHGVTIATERGNLLADAKYAVPNYDLIVTDEFLTVLKNPDKPQIVSRWKQMLKPGGAVVTTAMIGGVTTPELRARYAERSLAGLERQADLFKRAGTDHEDVARRFAVFASLHTRHMVDDEDMIRKLFEGFRLEFAPIVTPGECVNPTTSFQIFACKE